MLRSERLLFLMCACLSSCSDCSSASKQARWHGLCTLNSPAQWYLTNFPGLPRSSWSQHLLVAVWNQASPASTVGCVCVCVWSCVTTRVALVVPHPHLAPSPFASTGSTGFLHVVPALSWCFIIKTLLSTLTDKWVFLWLTRSFK